MSTVQVTVMFQCLTTVYSNLYDFLEAVSRTRTNSSKPYTSIDREMLYQINTFRG